MAAGQIFRTLIQFTGLIVLARLLPPSDFGLVAMATAIVGVTSVLSDLGLSMSILREADLDSRTRDRLFYLNALLAAIVACIVWTAAPSVAGFYSEPRLEQVTRWLAVFTFLGGLAPQYRAELARTHRFRALASVDTIAQAVALVAACLAALRGAGYWSVVIQQGTAATVLTVILMMFSRYIPRSKPGLRGIKKHASIGAAALGLQTTNYLAVNAAPVAIGRMVGEAAVGLYTRAYQLVSFPLVQLAAPLTRVVLPIFAHVTDESALIGAAKRVHLALAYALLPLLAFIVIGGSDLSVLLFGSEWRSTGTIAQVLAVGGIFQVLGYVNYWLFAHLGRLSLLWLYEGGIWMFITAGYFVFGRKGAITVAALYSAGLLGNWLATTILGLRTLGLPANEFFSSSLKRLCLLAPALTVGCGVRLACAHSGWDSTWTVLAASASALLITFGLVAVSSSFRNELCEFFGLLDTLRRQRN